MVNEKSLKLIVRPVYKKENGLMVSGGICDQGLGKIIFHAGNVNTFSYICPDCKTETKYDVKWINKNLATCFVCKKCGKIGIKKALI